MIFKDHYINLLNDFLDRLWVIRVCGTGRMYDNLEWSYLVSMS